MHVYTSLHALPAISLVGRGVGGTSRQYESWWPSIMDHCCKTGLPGLSR